MRMNRFRGYMLGQGLLTVIVMVIFRSVSDRQVAGIIAGLLFLLAPSIVIWNEYRMGTWKKQASFWGSLCFLVFSALPIFILRVTNYGQPFEELSVLGVTGPMLHKFSNYFFIVLLLGFFIDSFSEKKKELKTQMKKGED
ncbi:MAG: hypothetical protein BroJett040_01360 [Oligoflexia bacterium]|nr:MAG: hypothetical protein BroJett040_01360 [Oligoflexia bacterium]